MTGCQSPSHGHANQAVNKIAQLEAKLSMAAWEAKFDGPIRFAPKTSRGGVLLHAEESSKSPALDTLPVGVDLTIRIPANVEYPWTGAPHGYWEVFTPDSLHGFLKNEEVAFLAMEYADHQQLLIGMDYSNPKQTYVSFITYEPDATEPGATFKFPREIEVEEVKLIQDLALPNLPQLVMLRGKDRLTGKVEIDFIADIDNRFQTLFQAYENGEGDNFDTRAVYFPIKCKSGNLLWIKNGDIDHIFNMHSASLDTFDILQQQQTIHESDALGSEVVVVVTEEGQYHLNDSGKIQYKYSGKIDAKITKHEVELFQWDGKQLMSLSD